ncbi:MAG: hypothetical protein CYPHOPRED_005303 [Cyphobasidiales sp. Tagirdzhanova-0007]|nr:MAG: hypothetical protein CYPHOPRED_005303 [Cyphobasidiales sp. Tagirdzhanova-0007]
MSADLSSDPAISASYNELRDHDSPLDWLNIGYAPEGPKDKLVLVARGQGGLESLTQSLTASIPPSIQFGLLRVEGRFLLVTVLPEDTGGVRRARALVHSRAVGAKLSHQASLSIARPEDLTLGLVRNKLKLDTGSPPSSLPPSPNPQALNGHTAFGATVHSGGASDESIEDQPPHIPEKAGAQLARMYSTASRRSASPSSTAMRNQMRSEFESSESFRAVPAGCCDGVIMFAKNGPNNGPAVPPVDTKLAIPVGTNRTSNGVHRSASSRSTASPRLASLPLSANETTTGPLSGQENITQSPRLSSSSAKPLSRAPSTAGSQKSTTTTTYDKQPLPPTPYAYLSQSTRREESNAPGDVSMELSTLERMLHLSDSDMNVNSHASPPDPPPATSISKDDVSFDKNVPQRAPLTSTSTEADRQRVAEAIAMAAQQRWQSDQRTSLEVPPGPSASYQLSTDGETSENAGTARTYGKEALQHKLLIEQERLQNLKSEQRELESAKRSIEEYQSVAVSDGVVTDHAEDSTLQQAPRNIEKERLLEVQQAEADRLAVLKAEEEQLLLKIKKQAEENARQAALRETQNQERQRQQRREEEERSLAHQSRMEEERQRMERERLENIARSDREAKEAADTLIREKEEKRVKAKEGLQSRIDQGQGQGASQAVLTGFLSAQGGSTILWKRRFFEMTSTSLNLYKNDTSKMPVDTIQLIDHVKSIEEDGEELLAIPCSFKMLFKDYDEEPILFYCDEEDDKELLIAGLKLAAHL